MANLKPNYRIVADRAMEEYYKGNECPKIKFLMKPLKKKIPTTRKGICNLFQQVRDHLEGEEKRPSCSVNYRMYQENIIGNKPRPPFYEKPPVNIFEARKCLTGGLGNKMVGLWIPNNGDNDLIYRGYLLRFFGDSITRLIRNKRRGLISISAKVLPSSISDELNNELIKSIPEILESVKETIDKSVKESVAKHFPKSE